MFTIIYLHEWWISHLKMDGWKTILSFWVSAYFLGRTVSFREGNSGCLVYIGDEHPTQLYRDF